MQVIHKHFLQKTFDTQIVQLRPTSQLLTVVIRGENVVFWERHTTEDKSTQDYEFRIVPPGDEVELEGWNYLSTVFVGILVYHIFWKAGEVYPQP